MFKLLKYELSQHYLPFVIVGLVFLLSMIIVCSYKDTVFQEAIQTDTVLLFSVIFAFLSSIGLCVVIIMSIINSFGKNLFGKYGYLLFCLPLRIDSILWAKILSNVFLIGGSFLFYGFVCIQTIAELNHISLMEISSTLFSQLQATQEWSEFIFMIFIACVFTFLGTLVFILEILLTLALLNIAHISSFRFVVGLVIYFIITIICGCFYGLTGALLGINDTYMGEYFFDSAFIYYTIASALQVVGAAVILYFLSRYLILHKLELE